MADVGLGGGCPTHHQKPAHLPCSMLAATPQAGAMGTVGQMVPCAWCPDKGAPGGYNPALAPLAIPSSLIQGGFDKEKKVSFLFHLPEEDMVFFLAQKS